MRRSYGFLFSLICLGARTGGPAAQMPEPPPRPSPTGYTDTPLLPWAPPWRVHDDARPRPDVVAPGPAAEPVPPPGDAVILFDGTDLSAWVSAKTGGPAEWKVGDGWFEVAPKSGDIRTSAGFGSCQLHIEWAAPAEVSGNSQGRGNSGVFLMGLYEIQVLDSYDNVSYADGQAGAVYGQFPPLVNACRPPGQWQTYDIVFERPRFGEGGEVERPAVVTVFHNGVLIHNRRELMGPMAHKKATAYAAHADRLPIGLQEHGNPVRFRNVWVREIEER